MRGASVLLSELANRLGVELYGDGTIAITGVASLASAQPGQISFLTGTQHQHLLEKSAASAVMLREENYSRSVVPPHMAVLVVKDPYLAYAKIAQWLDITPRPAEGISERATIAPNVTLGVDVAIGPNVVIESGVTIGDGVAIGAGCFIGKESVIGAGSRIWANVSIYHDVTIGENCLIQANSVIGSDGFGYANAGGEWIKIPQIGGVRIGNKVEIGACTTIDRGALDDTVIGDGVIIDNLCQIAHNVEIGDHTAVAGGVIMAGSLTIGRYCQIGGASVINGHMSICDNVVITGMGMVMRAIDKPGVYSSGIPLQPNKQWRRTAVLVMGIDAIDRRLKRVEQKVKEANE